MRDGQPGWFASLLGAAVLIAGGFTLGLVAGVVSEEPELVVGHLVGRSDEVTWLPDGEPELTAPGEEVTPFAPAAPGPDGARPVDSIARSPALLPDVAAAPPVPATGLRARATSATAPASATPRPHTLPAAAASGFAVQVGAFADATAAGDVQRKLEGRGFDSYVIPAARSGDGKWRVRVGPVASREAADSLATRLKSEERLPTWVLSEGGG